MKIRVRIIKTEDYRVTLLPENYTKKLSVRTVLFRFVDNCLNKGYVLEDQQTIDNLERIRSKER